MPRASGLHGAHAPIVKRPYANIIYGREQDEDVADALVGTWNPTHNQTHSMWLFHEI